MASRKSKSKARGEPRNPQPQDAQQTQENSISIARPPLITPEPPAGERPNGHSAPAGARAVQTNSASAVQRDQERVHERSANRLSPDERSSRPVDTETVPDDVRERYVPLGRRYYLPSGDLAWEDHGTKLTTQSENREILRDMFETSAARDFWGQNAIEVTGTENFRRTMWEFAARAGIEVRGYVPTKFEEAELVRSMGRHAAAQREQNGTADPPRSEERARQSEPPAQPAREARGGAAQGERIVRGTLVDHGRETFNFDPHETMSYFVEIRTAEGKVERLWGLDLERALADAKSRPKKGDEIVARQTGQEPVTVKKVERDGEGRVVGERDLDTHKNHWQVETRTFTHERGEMAATVRDRKVSADRAVEKFPALAGTYAALREAELYAEQTYADPQTRRRFQAKVREDLADDIARGEPLVTTRVRQQRTYERQQTPGGPAAPEYAPV